MSQNCRIYKTFNRPSQELVSRFNNVSVANIDDCMGRLAAVNDTIRPIGVSGILGPALTIKVPEGDNLMMHYAMDIAQEGDVLVIDAGGCTNRSIFGGLMTEYLAYKKIGGIVVDGAVRDTDEIINSGIPVYAKAINPNGPWKNGPGEVNTPVHIGGRVVYPGDIVIADNDGVIFVRPEQAEDVLGKVSALLENEKKILDRIHYDGTMDRLWVMEKLKALNCEFFDTSYTEKF